MSIKSCEKVALEYYCEICNYFTSRKSSYDKHNSTAKHKKSIQSIVSCEKVAPKFYCDNCNKLYKEPSGLWRHKKKLQCCSEKQNIIINDDTKNLTELVMKVIEQNQDLTKQIIELSKTPHSFINNSMVNSNNKFNLNVYLNETCKDAMNIMEFVNQLQVGIKDLEETGRLGYAEGISKIFINGLNQINISDRPIHCSDSKREIVYIKDKNQWTKDDNNKSLLTNAIKYVAHKNMKQISEWTKCNKEYSDSSSKQNDRYQKIVSNSMNGLTVEETNKNYNKIIKNIVRETVIEK